MQLTNCLSDCRAGLKTCRLVNRTSQLHLNGLLPYEFGECALNELVWTGELAAERTCQSVNVPTEISTLKIKSSQIKVEW